MAAPGAWVASIVAARTGEAELRERGIMSITAHRGTEGDTGVKARLPMIDVAARSAALSLCSQGLQRQCHTHRGGE